MSWLGQSERGEDFTYNTESQGSYLFPGHKYLGPGNSINSGKPIDDDDKIAQAHDNDYARAKTLEDIRKADREAIQDFGRDFINKGNVHSAVGGLGLAGKYLKESITGVKYPSISGNLICPKKKEYVLLVLIQKQDPIGVK